MRKKRNQPRFTHSATLILERGGMRTESGVMSTSQMGNMIIRFREIGMEPVATRHSRHCLCGDGNNEIVRF